MKKFLLTLVVLAAGFVMPMIAEESQPRVWDHGDNISNITYQNLHIHRVYDQKDAYVVLYQTQGIKVAKAVIPKDWTKNEGGVARKALVRNKPAGLDSYMTVIKQDGEFLKVILTIPSNRFNPIWSVVPGGYDVDTNIETLDLEL